MDLLFFISLLIVAANLAAVWLLFHQRRVIGAFTFFSRDKLGRVPNALAWTGSFLLFLAVWGILSRLEPSGINKIPGPLQTLTAGWRLMVSGELLQEAWISFLRVAIGFILATIAGVTVGLLAGSFLLINRLVVPVTSFLRYIPPTAFISLLIVYFGIGETHKYAVIFLGVIFFIIQMVIDAVEDLDRRYLEMGQTMGYSNAKIFRKVIVPASWPRVLDVLRINLSAAWTFLVAAEIIGAQTGLGHLIAVSQRFLRIDELYVGILTFGIIGIITDRGIDIASRRLFRWHYISLRQ